MEERGLTLPLILASSELARMAGIKWPGEWSELIDVFNVFSTFPGRDEHGDLFPFPQATVAAHALKQMLGERTLTVLLGRRVERAWNIQPQEWFRNIGGVVVAPHPSKVSRFWNSRVNRLAAEEFWHGVARIARGVTCE